MRYFLENASVNVIRASTAKRGRRK